MHTHATLGLVPLAGALSTNNDLSTVLAIIIRVDFSCRWAFRIENEIQIVNHILVKASLISIIRGILENFPTTKYWNGCARVTISSSKNMVAGRSLYLIGFREMGINGGLSLVAIVRKDFLRALCETGDCGYCGGIW
ncbi:Uncharacterized protein TCM_012800 [Theobroma cacao]|uniref:Uncharacterized protein n=1 Tax=Theobroma cacao TaxID=3641 RepID=A0A061FWS7_THECC|nr:Uncharacterized protein TCM_012800 [Theobroma cacao]